MSMEEPTTSPIREEAAIDKTDPTRLLIFWDHIPWEKVENHVNKLQMRIVKALKKGKLHLVKRLQYLISNSFAAKLLAVKRVTSNKGKKTPGVDGKTWKTSRQKLEAAKSLTGKNYKSSPLRRVFIKKKGKNKNRPLGIPTIYDRAIQALYALALDPVAETTADKRSLGFRKYKSAKDASRLIFNMVAKKTHAQWILEGDIKSCYDKISHQWILDNIPLDRRILKQFLKSGYEYKRKLFPTEEGAPQGGIISPIIANMTLDGMENMLQKRFWTGKMGTIARRYNKDKVNFVRYADDFIVTGKSKEVLEEVREMLKGFLKVRGLELSEEKTKITHIQEGFNFLGWNIRKYKEKLLIKPSKDSIKTIRTKIKTEIRKHRGNTQDTLINVLNPKIRGWCNYHNHVVSSDIFKKLDAFIFKALWRWAKRRHSNKNCKWIKDKYWKRIENRDWIFKTEKKQLIFASSVKIKRHNLVKLDTNPYLKEDKEYLMNRRKTSH